MTPTMQTQARTYFFCILGTPPSSIVTVPTILPVLRVCGHAHPASLFHRGDTPLPSPEAAPVHGPLLSHLHPPQRFGLLMLPCLYQPCFTSRPCPYGSTFRMCWTHLSARELGTHRPPAR